MKTYDELRKVGKKFVDSYFTSANFPKSPSNPRAYQYATDRYGRILYRERLTKRALDGAKAPRKSKRSTGSPRK